MTIFDLHHLLVPSVGSVGSLGALVGIWIITSRFRKRDVLETDMFRQAFQETKDPCVLGYYAQMRSGRRRFTWPRRRLTRKPDGRRPPPSVGVSGVQAQQGGTGNTRG